jgi:hypothetical protein
MVHLYCHRCLWMVTSRGSALLGGFHLKLHREFLFRGFQGHSVRVAVYRWTLYQGLTVSFVTSMSLSFFLQRFFFQFVVVESVRVCKNSFRRLWCSPWYSVYFSGVRVNRCKSRNYNQSVIAALQPIFHITCNLAKLSL